MTDLNRISVDTVLFGGANSLPCDIDVGARALVLAHTEMDTILRSRGCHVSFRITIGMVAKTMTNEPFHSRWEGRRRDVGADDHQHLRSDAQTELC
jgi:hypothetical protein